MREKDYFLHQCTQDVENKFYVYLHKRPSDNCVFYVGKGSGTRAWKVNDRNNKWNNTYRKYGMLVEILAKDLSEVDAFELESRTISMLKESGTASLCNFTEGGEGISGYRHSAESKELFSNRMKKSYNSAMAAKMADGVREYYKHNDCVKQFSGKPWRHPNVRVDVWANFEVVYAYKSLGMFSKEIFPNVSLWNMIDHIENGLTPEHPDYLVFKQELSEPYSLDEFPLKALKHYVELYPSLSEICSLVRLGHGYVNISNKTGIPRQRLQRLVSTIKKDSNFETKLQFIKERLEYGSR